MMIDSSDDDWPANKRNIVFHSARGNHANGKTSQFPFTIVPWAFTHLPHTPSPTKARYIYTYKLPQLLFFLFSKQHEIKTRKNTHLAPPHTSKKMQTLFAFFFSFLPFPSFLTLTLSYLYTPPISKIKRKRKKKNTSIP